MLLISLLCIRQASPHNDRFRIGRSMQAHLPETKVRLMSKKHKHSNHQHHHQKPKKQMHKDWRIWTAVILMLMAMFAYVMTDDESLPPGADEPMPVERAIAE